MGYTVYWKNVRKLSPTEVIRVRRQVMQTFENELKKDRLFSKWQAWHEMCDKGDFRSKKFGQLDKYFHEGFGPSMIGNSDFEFCKTARKPYDRSVKKALIKLQKLTKNAYRITCDDGGKYRSDTVLRKTEWGNYVPRELKGV